MRYWVQDYYWILYLLYLLHAAFNNSTYFNIVHFIVPVCSCTSGPCRGDCDSWPKPGDTGSAAGAAVAGQGHRQGPSR